MNQRYYALDVFRGATVALMILVNNPGNWANIYAPFEHATWHGCTPTDLVFPFFLFTVGNAIAFVVPRLREKRNAYFLQKVVKRTLLIFAIGIFLNWSPFVQWKDNGLIFKPWENIRILGVLQRIAICYFFGSLIVYFFRIRGSLVISAVLLVTYNVVCYYFGRAGDPYSLPGYFGTATDKAILGVNHMYKGEGVSFDPEGLGSTLAAIVQVVLGFFAGKYIREKGKTWEMLSHLFLAGSLLVFAGYCWDMIFPINKKIWTSSFVLYTSGLAAFVLGLLIYLIEFKKARGIWSRFFDVFGKNPLFIFFLSGFLPRLLGLIRWTDHVDASGHPVYLSPLSWIYQYICKPLSPDLKIGSLIYAISMVAFYWLIGYILDRKKIYLKV